MKVENTRKELKMISEDEVDQDILKFIAELNNKGAFIELITTFADMINKEMVRVQDGQIVWCDQWTLIQEQIPGYQ